MEHGGHSRAYLVVMVVAIIVLAVGFVQLSSFAPCQRVVVVKAAEGSNTTAAAAAAVPAPAQPVPCVQEPPLEEQAAAPPPSCFIEAPPQQPVWADVVPVISGDAPVSPEVAAQVLALEREGRGRKIIAMSLYGKQPRYTMGAIDNMIMSLRDWQNWTFRLYYDDSVPADVVLRMKGIEATSQFALELVRVDSNLKANAGRFWRFFSLEDRTATRIIFRDVDSRLTKRDRKAVEEWMESGRYFHMMHDHRAHSSHPVLAGMWGVVNGFVNPKLVADWRANDTAYGIYGDQDWLRDKVWPHAKDHALAHSSFYCNKYGEAEWRGFPTPRDSFHDFVGNVYHPTNEFEGLVLDIDCPEECRRNATWVKC